MIDGALMPITKEQVREAAMQLSDSEKEALAEELLSSLRSEEAAAVDAAWLAEAERRFAEYQANPSIAEPADAVMARIGSRIGR